MRHYLEDRRAWCKFEVMIAYSRSRQSVSEAVRNAVVGCRAEFMLYHLLHTRESLNQFVRTEKVMIICQHEDDDVMT
jgi:hypothetical protein